MVCVCVLTVTHRCEGSVNIFVSPQLGQEVRGWSCELSPTPREGNWESFYTCVCVCVCGRMCVSGSIWTGFSLRFIPLCVRVRRRLEWTGRAPHRPPLRPVSQAQQRPDGNHGEHAEHAHTPQPPHGRGPAGPSTRKLGDGLHRERRGLLHRVRMKSYHINFLIISFWNAVASLRTGVILFF